MSSIIEALNQAEALLRAERPGAALALLGTREPADDLPVLVRLTWYWLVGWALGARGQSKESERVLGLGITLAEQMPSPMPQMLERLRLFHSMALSELGQTARAWAILRSCQAAIERGVVSDPELKLRIYLGLARLALALGRPSEAISAYQLAISTALYLEDVPLLGQAYCGLALAFQQNHQPLQARHALQQTLALLGQRLSQQMVIHLHALLGKALTATGQYDEAAHHLEQSLALAHFLGETEAQAHALIYLAELELARGLFDQASAAASEGATLAHRRSYHALEGELRLLLGEASMGQGDQAAAGQAFQDAVEVSERSKNRALIGRARQRLAEFYAALGNFQFAYEQMRAAYEATHL